MALNRGALAEAVANVLDNARRHGVIRIDVTVDSSGDGVGVWVAGRRLPRDRAVTR